MSQGFHRPRLLASLPSRLVILVLVAIVPAIGLVLYTAHEQNQQSVAAVQTDSYRLTQLAAANQEQIIDSTRQFLIAIASLRLPQDSSECSDVLAELHSHTEPYRNIGIIRADGTIACSAVPPSVPVNLAHRAFVERAIESGGFVVGDYQIDPITRAPTVFFSYPLRDPIGDITGVAFAALDLAWFNRLIEETELPPGGTMSVLDRNGTVVAQFPDADAWVGRGVQDAPVAIASSRQRTGLLEATGIDGMSRLYAYQSVGGIATPGLTVSIGLPRDTAFIAASRTLSRNLIALLLVTGVAVAAAWLGGEVFIRRNFRSLLAVTRRLTAGDLRARTRLSSGLDEVRELAEAFDHMAATLEQRITAQEEAEAALQESALRFESVVETASDAIILADSKGQIIGWNPGAVKMFGFEKDEILGSSITALMPARYHGAHQTGIERVAATGESQLAGKTVEITALHKDGHEFPIELSLTTWKTKQGRFFSAFIRDITERKEFEDRISYQAFYDPLTTLPNRALFLDRLDHAFARSAGREQALAVLFIDLDNFKVINDSLGHQLGDELLTNVTGRLRGIIRPEDTVARLGGDEFTILMEEINDVSDAVRVAERVLERLQQPLTLHSQDLFISASIGIAVNTLDRNDPITLLKAADVAMYRAKASGKAQYEVFDAAMGMGATERLQMETDLRRALERDEFRIFYQPIVDLRTHAVREVEALVRWVHPERGIIAPLNFIPLAEETGLIMPLGQWVLREACRQIREWQQQRPLDPPLRVSVNLSPRQFRDPHLVENVAEILTESGLDPACLNLEITESATMDDTEAVILVLQRLKALGVGIAIDDFGTGYSSLAYLKQFPIDTLKVDKLFVDGLRRDDQGSDAIIRAVLMFAQSMHLKVTGEGIETLEQLEELKQMGCQQGQGYYFARPLSSEAMGALLTRTATQHNTLTMGTA